MEKRLGVFFMAGLYLGRAGRVLNLHITHVQYMLLDGIYHLRSADARVTQICLAEYP